MSEIHLVAYDAVYSPHIKRIRELVFIAEQGVPVALEFDGLDTLAQQLLVTIDGQYVGTGRMLDDGRIGRIAILKEARGLGLGKKVVQSLVNEAARLGYPRVYLGAQTQALDFYAKLGFTPFGEQYMDADIPHLAMELIVKGEG